MVGWIEEVHKGLEGLRRHDIGRLLNALHGFTWGLSWVMQVQRGVLVSGDNGFYHEIAAALGPGSRWTQLWAIAFGVAEIEGRQPSLRERVVAGMWLYAHTAELLGDALQPEHAMLVQAAVNRIKDGLGQGNEGSVDIAAIG
jgi:hypothetical protein